MMKHSVNNLIKKYKLKVNYIFLENLNSNFPEIKSFVKKSTEMFSKYSEKELIIDKYHFLNNFENYLKRTRTSKITLENFKILGLTEVEYKKYCYIKTKKFVEDASKNGKLGIIAKKQDMLKNPEKYKDIQPNQLGYWIKKGYSEEDAKKQLSKSQTTFSLQICIDKYGIEEGTKVFNKRQEKWQETLNSKPQEEIDRINKSKNPFIKKANESYISFLIRSRRTLNKLKMSSNNPEIKRKIYLAKLKNGILINENDLPDFKLYSRKVRIISEKQNLKTLLNFKNRGRYKFHLDHKRSIFQCFKDNIPIYIAGSILNLEFLYSTENLKKNKKSSISKELLISKFFN